MGNCYGEEGGFILPEQELLTLLALSQLLYQSLFFGCTSASVLYCRSVLLSCFPFLFSFLFSFSFADAQTHSTVYPHPSLPLLPSGRDGERPILQDERDSSQRTRMDSGPDQEVGTKRQRRCRIPFWLVQWYTSLVSLLVNTIVMDA